MWNKERFFLFVVANFNKKLGKTCSILHRLHHIKYSLRSCFKTVLCFLQMISKYLKNTHASTHNQYDMELLDVFALEHEKKDFTDVGNR